MWEVEDGSEIENENGKWKWEVTMESETWKWKWELKMGTVSGMWQWEANMRSDGRKHAAALIIPYTVQCPDMYM